MSYIEEILVLTPFMRKRFEVQYTIGCTPIEEVKIPVKKRGTAMLSLMAALQYIYVNPYWNEKIFNILDEKLLKDKKATGRKGMSLWEIFVLSQVRLCQDLSFDDLEYQANTDTLLRGILGVLPSDYSLGREYTYQNLYDNLILLDNEVLIKINNVIVEVGHEVFKKKENTALRLKTDSYVVETNTHFPTDYNLLWDSARKCLDTVEHLGIAGWRKSGNWYKELKILMRVLGKTAFLGGANKTERLTEATNNYLKKARALELKLFEVLINYKAKDEKEIILMDKLFYYFRMLSYHITLIDRRLIKGEVIPHEEKIFSIFQPYTEMIKKGKLRPNVEIGKKLTITTDQFNLIIDWQIAESQTDNQLTIEIVDRILNKYKIESISFDKGFSDKEDRELLGLYIPEVVMPKKGKLSKSEKELESSPAFKKTRNKHSAVESNINELEHRGLNRCPDRTERGFNRYIALGVTAYNLAKIGKRILTQRLDNPNRQAA